MQYDSGGFNQGRRMVIMGLGPVAAANMDLEEVQGLGRNLTPDEWIRLLINTCILDLQACDPWQGPLCLCRLLPLMERNMHLVELEPYVTDETCIYRNMTRYVRIFNEGGIYPAILSHNAAMKRLGKLAVRGPRYSMKYLGWGPGKAS